MDYIFIKDTITGKTIDVIQDSYRDYIIIEDDAGEHPSEPRKVKERSMGKVMRTWMRARMKDV